MSDKLQKMQEGAKSVGALAPAQAKEAAHKEAGNALDSISLDKLKIEEGKITFVDHRQKSEQKIEGY